MVTSSFTPLERILAGLTRIGFARQPGGFLRHGNLALRINKPWLRFELPLMPGDSSDPLLGWISRPGLWKSAGSAKHFEMPINALSSAGDSDEMQEHLQAIINWVTSTAGADTSTCRPAIMNSGHGVGAAENWLPTSNDLVLRHECHVCRGAVIREGSRLALRMPILRRFRSPLIESRSAWLRELLVDAQYRCPMVRIGLDSPDAAVDAVADISGCPGECLESIIRAGRDALCWTVEWLVSSVDLLADPEVISDVLQFPPAWAWRPSK